jgi:hypothetical protein
MYPGRAPLFYPETRGVRIFQLLDVALLNLAHQIIGDISRNDHKLIVDHFIPRNGSPYRNQMRSPLKDKAEIPGYKTDENQGCENKASPRRRKMPRDCGQQES